MKWILNSRLVGLALLALACFVGTTEAGIYWYNGDPTLSLGGLKNGVGVPFFGEIREYDDFVVSQNVNLNCVFANIYTNNPGITEAYWEIRTGVSAGNPGTFIAGGTSAATLTTLGISVPGFTSYHLEVDNISVALTPGTYWLSVAPVAPPGNSLESYLFTTDGDNSIGIPGGNNGNAFVYSPGFFNYVSADILHGGWPPIDYSLGVCIDDGPTNLPDVPEPSSIVTMLGLLACAGTRYAWKRRSRSASQRG